MKASVWRPIFLEQLRLTGNVSEAASIANVGRTTVYRHRDRSKRFAQQWDEALEEACDLMEREAFRRAVEGVDKPIYYQGKRIDLIKEYSDTLLIFMLKAHRPGKYKEQRQSVNFDIDYSKLTDQQLERIARGEDPLAVIRQGDTETTSAGSERTETPPANL